MVEKSSHNRIQQTAISLVLFALIFCSLAALHIYSIFFYSIGLETLIVGPVLIAVMAWLFAGLFIVAHDAMHGSLAPGRTRLNATIGAFILLLYAGFDWQHVKSAHIRHHKHPGTEEDPDFNAANPQQFWPWYIAFIRRYFGPKQMLFVSSIVALYLFIFDASLFNIVLFYGAPAILSSGQLFYFGTYLPHRHEVEPFIDEHNARSNEYSLIVSLLTCFHFGYHREHHLVPGAPWWRLPTTRNSICEAL